MLKLKLILGKIPTQEEIAIVKNKKMIDNIQKVIDEDIESKISKEILDKLLEKNKIEMVAKALINIIVNESSNLKNEQKNFAPDEEVKLFLNVGKKDKIMVKDIVGSISANTAASGSDIGKINILDSFTFIDVPGRYVNEIITSMKGKQIKGRNVKFEIANS